jgi:hypothetical protein
LFLALLASPPQSAGAGQVPASGAPLALSLTTDTPRAELSFANDGRRNTLLGAILQGICKHCL